MTADHPAGPWPPGTGDVPARLVGEELIELHAEAIDRLAAGLGVPAELLVAGMDPGTFPPGWTPSPLGWSPRPAGYLGKWPPVCNACGHRHAPGTVCADHPWADSCPYDAGPGCPTLVPVDDGDAADAGLFTTDARDERPPADVVTHLAICHACAEADPMANADLTSVVPVPFATAAQRDRWASRHADVRRHRVTLAEQRPGVGSTIIGHADPDPEPPAGPPRGQATPPLLAFVMPGGGKAPSLMCRVPNRAGAAWLAYAAHACLLGRQGSSGIAEPHRVMMIGRVTAPTEQAGWTVRIDGLIGATDKTYGRPVGDVYEVDSNASLPDVEDLVEGIIAGQYEYGRHTFSVLLVTDAPLNDPPDPHADATLRAAAASAAAPCCTAHNERCEPPGDLCCAGCTEAGHPAHPRGTTCVRE